MSIKNELLFKNRSSLAIGSLLLLTAFGQSTASADDFSIGAGVLIEQSPYKDYDRQVYPMPIINWQSEYFFVTGLNAGIYALHTENHRLFVQIDYLPNQFKSSKTDNNALKKLDDRKASFMSGIGYEYKADWGDITANLLTDISGRSDGIIADMAYGYPFQLGRFHLKPQVGVAWQNRKYNDYYFGVSETESSRSGLKKYSPESGSTPYISMNAHYSINDSWDVFLIGRYVRLSNEIKDSPMTSRSSATTVATGVMYRF